MERIIKLFTQEWPIITITTINQPGRHAWHRRLADEGYILYLNAAVIDYFDRDPSSDALTLFLFACICHEMGHYVATRFHGLAYDTPPSLKGRNIEGLAGEIGEVVEVNIFGGLMCAVWGDWDNVTIVDAADEYEGVNVAVVAMRFWAEEAFGPVRIEEKAPETEESARDKATIIWRRSAAEANAGCGGRPARIRKRIEKVPGGMTGIGSLGDVFR